MHTNIFQGLALVKTLFTIFALFAWSRAVIRFYSKDLNVKELVFWTFTWALMVVLVFIPGKTNFFANILGIDRGNDAVFFLAIVVLFYATYRLYVKSNEAEKEITRLVRALALKNVFKSKRRAVKRRSS
jgi:small membrane protein